MQFGGPSGKMPGTSNHSFSQVPRADIPRSSFDRSHGLKTTFSSGFLVPVLVDEALPGDTFNVQMAAFCRLATPIVPVMDNLYLDSFFFAVPYRLVWDNWEKFNGSQVNPGDSTDFLIPQIVSPSGGWATSSLEDYFGLPTIGGNMATPNTVSVSSLWHRAYNLIFNEWFRDQNLQDSLVVQMDDGPDTQSNYTLQRRGRRHDYFTSCLPWPQKGPAVTIPLGGMAPVTGIGKNNQSFTSGPFTVYETGGTGSTSYANGAQITDASLGAGSGHFTVLSDPANAGFPGIYADLSLATAETINALRQAFQLQRLFERDARGGTRYTEIVRSHFGVMSPDARLQRPEYLGGKSTQISFTPIPQTSQTDPSVTPQGNLAALATAMSTGNGFVKSFTEHCLIIGMVSVRADQTYQQGLNRMWSRQGRFDFYWPALSHIGEQSVFNQEIYVTGTATDTEVFGYQERYAEYRYKPSMVTGQYKSTFAQPLDSWHLARHFTSLPTLGATFIQETPPVQRIVAVESPYPEFLGDFHFQYMAARPMPTYSVPGMIDHF